MISRGIMSFLMPEDLKTKRIVSLNLSEPTGSPQPKLTRKDGAFFPNRIDQLFNGEQYQ